MLSTIFPPKQFPSIGTMVEETYVNIARSQCDKLNNSNCITDIYWFWLSDIWDLSALDEWNYSKFLFTCNLYTEFNM